MKTISIQTGRTLSFEHSQTLGGTAGSFPGLARRQARLAQWLPTPSPRVLSATKNRPVKKTRTADSLWIPLPDETIGEKLMIGLLAVAAMIAIGYGFSSMLDLVQDWAGFNRLAGQIIQ